MKDKNSIRMEELYKELNSFDMDNLTEAEEKRSDELIKEFNSLKTIGDINDINKFMHAPITQPIKPDIGGSADNPDSIKLYNRSNLNELRSFIRSQDKTGITESANAGKFFRGICTGDWKGSEVEKRALGTATSGGNWLVPEIISSIIIPMSLNKSMCFRAGAYSIPMESKTLVIPKITGMPSTEWKVENEAYAEDTGMEFSGITLTAKTLMALVKLSVELASDGVNVDQVIEDAITDAIGLALDYAILNGSGIGEPLGILNHAILEEDLAYTPISSFDFLSNAYFKLEAENEIATALIAPSAMFANLDLLKNLNLDRLQPPLSYEGTQQKPSYLKLSSNQLTNSAVLGDFSKVVVGFRTDLQVDVSDKTGDSFQRLQVWIRAFMRVAVGIKRENAFVHIKQYGELAS